MTTASRRIIGTPVDLDYTDGFEMVRMLNADFGVDAELYPDGSMRLSLTDETLSHRDAICTLLAENGYPTD